MPDGLLKDIGGFFGFLSIAVVLFDRYYKGRPLGSLSTMTDGRVCIRFKNITNYDVAIMDCNIEPPIYRLARSTDANDTLACPQLLLKPDEAVELIIIPKGGSSETSYSGKVDFYFSWRSGNSTWLPKRSVPVCTSTQTIQIFSTQALSQ